jgi:hypothetical protein
MLIYDLDCPTELVATNYSDVCVDLFRDSGATRVIYIKKDYQFTDILDLSEWETAFSNGFIGVTPKGMIEIPKPSITNEIIDGSGKTVELNRTYGVSFKTFQVGTNYADFDFWSEITSEAASYAVMILDTHGALYMDSAYAAPIRSAVASPFQVLGVSPGLDFSYSEAPANILEGTKKDKVKWEMTLDIVHSGVMTPAVVPGLAAVLQAK